MSRNKILTKTKYEEIENMNRHIISQEIESVINNIQIIELRPNDFTSEFY